MQGEQDVEEQELLRQQVRPQPVATLKLASAQ